MWIAAIKAGLREEWLNLGTAGPAIAAIVLSSRRGRDAFGGGIARWSWFVVLLVPCWIVFSLHSIWRASAGLPLRLDPLLILPAMLPAWILSGALSPQAGVSALLLRLVHPPNRWSFYALVSFPAFLLIPAAIVRLFGGQLAWPQTDGPALVTIAKAAAFFGYNLLFVAVLEEPGWRGFLLDRLQLRFAPLPATLLVWLPWALWHGPLDYFRPVPFSPVMWVLLRVVFMIPMAIILTWFYNRSGRSIQAAVLFHASMNTFIFVLPYSQPAFALIFLWMIYAIIDGHMGRFVPAAASVPVLETIPQDR